MSPSPVPEPVTASLERAGIGLRLYAVVLALAAFGLGALGLFAAPAGWCRYLGYGLAVVMTPGGMLILFLGLRGRRSDLLMLTGKEAADIATNTAATTIAERIADEVMDKLT